MKLTKFPTKNAEIIVPYLTPWSECKQDTLRIAARIQSKTSNATFTYPKFKFLKYN